MQAREYVNSNMAQHTECMFNEYKFSEGLDIACNFLQVPSFYHDQKEALRNFFEGKDLTRDLVSVRRGFLMARRKRSCRISRTVYIHCCIQHPKACWVIDDGGH